MSTSESVASSRGRRRALLRQVAGATLAGLILVAAMPIPASAGSGLTERASVASDGTEGNGASFRSTMSDGGRYVAFHSWATNLVPDDTNGAVDVFVHDRETGATERISLASDGTQGNMSSNFPSITPDGRHVAFVSLASNLAPGDTNKASDVFVHDRETGVTQRISLASDGTEGNDSSSSTLSVQSPAITPDGRYVAFDSRASNLVPDDTNDLWDVFVHDRETGVTERVSVTSDGTEGNRSSSFPSISAWIYIGARRTRGPGIVAKRAAPDRRPARTGGRCCFYE